MKNSLQFLTESHGISEAELCQKINISKATFYRLLNGQVDPRASTLSAIASYFDISIDQLLGKQPLTADDVTTTKQKGSAAYIPTFSLSHTDKFIGMLGKTKHSNWDKWIEIESSLNPDCFSVEVIGDSMWPDFIEKTLLIIDPSITPKNRSYVLCHLHQKNEVIFRRFIQEGEEQLLKPTNPAYKTVPLHKKDKILGVVVQSKNNLK